MKMNRGDEEEEEEEEDDSDDDNDSCYDESRWGYHNDGDGHGRRSTFMAWRDFSREVSSVGEGDNHSKIWSQTGSLALWVTLNDYHILGSCYGDNRLELHARWLSFQKMECMRLSAPATYLIVIEEELDSVSTLLDPSVARQTIPPAL